MAYQLYKDGLCHCGQPISIAHDEAEEGWYEVHTSVCQACLVKDEHAKENKEPESGEMSYVVHDPEGIRDAQKAPTRPR